MRIQTKLPLLTSLTVFVSIVIITSISIFIFWNNSIDNIRNYKEEETAKVQNQIEDIVNIAYDMLTVTYQHGVDAGASAQQKSNKMKSVHQFTDSLMQNTLENIRAIKYGTDGYIWINKLNPPYEVVMHAEKPELEGSGHVFIIKDTKQNVYEAFADICNTYGEGFLQYDFYPPGGQERIPKMSFLKLFPPKNWVIGTGVYIDNIDKVVANKEAELKNQINRLIFLTLLVGLFTIAIAALVLFTSSKKIANAIDRTRERLSDMAKGREVELMKVRRGDEIGQMNKSLDELITGIASYSEFALEIGKGNLNAKFTALSEDDSLGNSLLAMRNSLINAKQEEEIRKEESAKRNWANEGYTLFNDILRKNQDNIDDLAYSVISQLVDYIGASLGGIYFYDQENQEDKHLKLIASYAYHRRKTLERKIYVKEGLVGACAAEMQTIFLTKIPDDYMEVRSGLGKTQPSNLLFVPLKVENQLFGVIEMASIYDLQKHEIEFVEHVSESIASTLSTVQINLTTQKLLEQTKNQAEARAAQEEELRQNLEELQTLKEQMDSNEEA